MPSFIHDVITPGARITLQYGDVLASDISSETFARVPEGMLTNSPAFCFGHLAIYPDRVLKLLGREADAQPDARFDDLFAAGQECQDDVDGTLYPSKDEIMQRFRERHEAALSVLHGMDDSVLLKPTPDERLVERFPTIGAAVTFLFGAHAMMHLGQVSTWRRAMGLGSAF
ncbi:MAG: DinB family protein [Planctomycetota bacterium]